MANKHPATRLVAAMLLVCATAQAGDALASPAPPDASPGQAGERSLEQGGSLRLTCTGDGVANKTDEVENITSSHVSGIARGPDGETDFSASKTALERQEIPRAQPFSDQLDVRIEQGVALVRVPRIMLPDLHGGKDGWFKTRKLAIDGDAITASVALSWFDNPKLRIDRRTGVVNLSGKVGDFVGHCRLTPTDNGERQF